MNKQEQQAFDAMRKVLDRLIVVDEKNDILSQSLAAAVAEALAAAEAVERSQEPVTAWTSDAENWGDALNSAGWEFNDAVRRHTGIPTTALLFNNCKAIIRDVILHYGSKVGPLYASKAQEPLIKFRHGCKWCGKEKCAEGCPGTGGR